jgi:ATP-binding cassette subfamily B protein
MGFAKNVRKKLFDKVQDFSFANVDKFSTASLITRLTTDVTNTQMSYMMLIRVFVRSPFMLAIATFEAFRINSDLAMTFVVAVPILAIALIIIAKFAFPLFEKMLKKYDALNASIQENLIGIRVVKAFVREDHESQKFRDASEKLRDMQYKAESVIIYSMPFMQLVVYGCTLAIYWFGGNLMVAGEMQDGELLGFITYIMQILMSLDDVYDIHNTRSFKSIC